MINSIFYVIFTFTFVSKTLYKELKIVYSNLYEQAHPIMTSISTKNLICMKQWQLLLEKTWQLEIMPHHMLISTWKRTLKCKSISIENEGEYEETSKCKETSSSSAQKRQHKKRNRMYEDDSCCYPFLGSHKTKQNEKWENTKNISKNIRKKSKK